MKITRRDLEAFFKKECCFRDGKIYLDDIEMKVFSQNDAIYFDCEQLFGLMKFYLNGKKHFQFINSTIKFSHPLFKFDDVKVDEDGIEITFK